MVEKTNLEIWQSLELAHDAHLAILESVIADVGTRLRNDDPVEPELSESLFKARTDLDLVQNHMEALLVRISGEKHLKPHLVAGGAR